MSLSVFSIIKNESQFIGYGVMSLLPYVDEICYADGNSTDGTLEILRYIQDKYDYQKKIKVFEGMDCKDFKSEYQTLFNWLMKQCNGKYLWYCHPDMILVKKGKIEEISKNNELAYFVNMRSFAGVDLDMEITKGRTNKWKTLMKNDLGLYYWGDYGDQNEDMYFKEIAGNEHIVHKDMGLYPFKVHDSEILLHHYCECKPYKRRYQKMETVLKTTIPNIEQINYEEIVKNHPRVNLNGDIKDFGDFEFKNVNEELPEVFRKYKKEFDSLIKSGG